jgi:hypothetical protein
VSSVKDLAEHRSICVQQIGAIIRNDQWASTRAISEAITRCDDLIMKAIEQEKYIIRFVDRNHNSIWVRK